MSDDTAERDRLWNEWLNEPDRTDKVREVARKLPPWGSYKLKETGQVAEPLAYAEDGTVRAYCWYDWTGRDFGHEVFGLDPDSFLPTGNGGSDG